ncbi:S1 RNA-binding domain-containing protein, partial [bacterium]|nr:S1 RNA-binding domain-containing protein [bacterium]
MAKEVLMASQYGKAETSIEDEQLQLNEEQQKELSKLYENTATDLKAGKIVEGCITSIDNDGVLVDISFKSDGLVPRFEFADHELKNFKNGDKIEVMIQELDTPQGNVIISYEQAKAQKAWEKIYNLFENGKPVEGVITHKVKGGLSVDVGIPAFLPGSQVDLQRITDFDQFVGQTIEAYIIKLNRHRGNIIISRRRYLSEQRFEERKKVLDTLENDQVIQGIVKNITNYGVFIDIGGVDGLLHITDMTWGRISHPSEMVKIGDTITVKILSFDKDNEKISLGIKQLSDNPWSNLEGIEIGQKIKGKISSITDYGLFVEVKKGVEGLVHISEVSWIDRINDLRKTFNVGEEVDALVVSIDKENRRMSLSIKQLDKNPWEKIGEQFKVEDKITGTVSNITDFGVFIQLIPGVDGLVHISDLSWTERIEHPSDIYKKNQQIEAVILSIDTENKKISLGVKQLIPNPWESIEEEYPVGKLVDGTISKITSFGAFVKLPTGIEGLVHTSEFGDQSDNIEGFMKSNEAVKFRVTKVNKDEHKLGLSLILDPKVTREPTEQKRPVVKRPTVVKQPRIPVARKAAPAQKDMSSPKGQLQLELQKHMKAAQEKSDKKEEAKAEK